METLWAELEARGWKDYAEGLLKWIGSTIDPFVPGAPEGAAGASEVVYVKGGEVVTGNDKGNVVLTML